MEIFCEDCGSAYPPKDLPFLCPTCGGLYDFRNPLQYSKPLVNLSQPGIWRYRHTFGISKKIKAISLGEGNTPLVWGNVNGCKVAYKCEYLNPSGSFKDRGSTVIATFLKSRGVHEAVEDSSGNAGASFAAYCACADIKAQIFIPSYSSGPKRKQILAYGGEIVPVDGTRLQVSETAKSSAVGGKVYASHAFLPFNIPGYATAAYEIYEQLGNKFPGTVMLPVGQGGLLLGIVRGFEALRIANGIESKFPKIIAVQAAACAPLWSKYYTSGNTTNVLVDNRTIAEGVQINHPVRKAAVLKAVSECDGEICLVNEEEISSGYNALARLGFFIEPTSAIVWAPLLKTIKNLPTPVVVILTGSGYKYE